MTPFTTTVPATTSSLPGIGLEGGSAVAAKALEGMASGAEDPITKCATVASRGEGAS